MQIYTQTMLTPQHLNTATSPNQHHHHHTNLFLHYITIMQIYTSARTTTYNHPYNHHTTTTYTST